MNRDFIAFRDYLKPGEDQKIRDITESSGVFYPDEINIAEELAGENLRNGADKSGYHYILADINSEVAGYACFGSTPCTKQSYDFYWLAVAKNFKGAGIGMRLMALTEEKITALGGRKIYIETSSRDPYIPARQLYLKCKYKEEAIIRDFYDIGDHKLIYVKDL